MEILCSSHLFAHLWEMQILYSNSFFKVGWVSGFNRGFCTKLSNIVALISPHTYLSTFNLGVFPCSCVYSVFKLEFDDRPCMQVGSGDDEFIYGAT